jgi:hypothetical protein
MGSCVLCETIRKGRPRFAPRVSLSILSIYVAQLGPRVVLVEWGRGGLSRVTRDNCIAVGSGGWGLAINGITHTAGLGVAHTVFCDCVTALATRGSRPSSHLPAHWIHWAAGGRRGRTRLA